MSDNRKVKTADVTEAIRFFMALTVIYTVDDEGYIVRCDRPNSRYKYSMSSGEQKELMVYNEVAPSNVLVVNPFAEGAGQPSPAQTFFYQALRKALIGRVSTIILMAIRFIQSQKGIKFNDPDFADIPASKPMLDLTGGNTEAGKQIISEVTDKTHAEIQSFLDRGEVSNDLISIVYNKNLGVSRVMIDIIENPNYTDVVELGKMSKKSFFVLKALMCNLFSAHSTNDLSKYSVKRPSRDVPGRMFTWMSVLYNLYAAINDVLDLVDPELTVNLSTFSYHLDNFAAYHGNAGWQLQYNETPQPAASGVQSVSSPVTSSVGVVPGVGAQVPQPMQMVQQTGMIGQGAPLQPGQGTVVPGPVRLDGSQAPATVVPTGPMASQMMMQQPMMMGQQQPMMIGGMMPGAMGYGQQPMMAGMMPQQPINPLMGGMVPQPMMMGQQPYAGYGGVPGMPYIR